MYEMADEYGITDKFHKVLNYMEEILGAFQVCMGQLMHDNTLVFQFTLRLDKTIKGFGWQNCCASEPDSTYLNDGVLLEIEPCQLGIKCHKISLIKRAFRIKPFFEILLTLEPFRKLHALPPQYSPK